MTAYVPAALAGGAALALAAGLRRVGWHPRAERGIARWALGRRLEVVLARAGSPLRASGFVLTVGAALSGAVGLAWRLTHTPAVTGVAGCCVVGAAVGYLRGSERRYRDRLGEQVPLVAQQLGGALAAGLSLRGAIERIRVDLPEPAASELGLVARQLGLGRRLDVVLDELADRSADIGLRMLVTAIVTQRISGGDLAGALGRLAEHLDDRARLAQEVHSATAQARLSAWLVAALPAAGGLMVEIAAPGTLERTLGQGPGRALLIAAAVAEAVGVIIVRRIVSSVGEGVTWSTR